MNTPSRQELDQQLIQSLRENRDRGFESLVNRFWSVVKAFIRYLGVPEEGVEDITQETFVKIHRNLDKIDPAKSLSAWIMTIARHTWYDELRHRKRLQRNDQQAGPVLPSLDVSEQAINRVSAEEFLSRLSESDRLLLEMRIFMDLPLQEISELTGETENCLRVRLHRLFKRFRPEPGKGEEL